ncbi:28718_t:CDS:2 [Racocetra persica]|uniref:28718_t:CDS:1 n=1 Tax=Racocetra persica TaxID=160502 RepID=A0ACA9QWZ5_9GLOM|nr:28718_t:CDS:2 [Racocetra persica]
MFPQLIRAIREDSVDHGVFFVSAGLFETGVAPFYELLGDHDRSRRSFE